MPESSSPEGEIVQRQQADFPTSSSKELESISAKERVFNAIVGLLAGKDGCIVRLNDHGRFDRVKVLVVDSADEKTHVTLDATMSESGAPEFVRGIYRDETTKTTGHVWWDEDARGSLWFQGYSSTCESDEMWKGIMSSYKETGGYSQWSIGGSKGQSIIDEQLTALAEKLEKSQTNPDLTNAAFTYITTKLGGEHIADEAQPASLPPLQATETKAIEQ